MIVRVNNSVVVEIIPDYALPIEEWYGASFAAQCVEAPDEVQQGWVYDAGSGTFSEPTTEEPEPTTEEQLRADVDFIALMTGVQL